jgi:hypothetical protein
MSINTSTPHLNVRVPSEPDPNMQNSPGRSNHDSVQDHLPQGAQSREFVLQLENTAEKPLDQFTVATLGSSPDKSPVDDVSPSPAPAPASTAENNRARPDSEAILLLHTKCVSQLDEAFHLHQDERGSRLASPEIVHIRRNLLEASLTSYHSELEKKLSGPETLTEGEVREDAKNFFARETRNFTRNFEKISSLMRLTPLRSNSDEYAYAYVLEHLVWAQKSGMSELGRAWLQADLIGELARQCDRGGENSLRAFTEAHHPSAPHPSSANNANAPQTGGPLLSDLQQIDDYAMSYAQSLAKNSAFPQKLQRVVNYAMPRAFPIEYRWRPGSLDLLRTGLTERFNLSGPMQRKEVEAHVQNLFRLEAAAFRRVVSAVAERIAEDLLPETRPSVMNFVLERFYGAGVDDVERRRIGLHETKGLAIDLVNELLMVDGRADLEGDSKGEVLVFHLSSPDKDSAPA